MTMTRTALSASAALALALTLSACGGDAPADGGSSAPAPSITTGSSPATPSTSPSDDAGSTTPTDSGTSAPTDDGTGTGTGASTDDRTASGLAAIATAESETGGVAYAIDDSDDDGGWEVNVRTGDSSVEVNVGADGSVVGTEPDDLDGDDRQILDGVRITLVQAIEAAVAETGGVLDDADLSDDDDQRRVEVTVDTADRDDVDVHLDPVIGEVLRVS